MRERGREEEGEGRVIKSLKVNILWHDQHNGMHNRPYEHSLWPWTLQEGREKWKTLNLNDPTLSRCSR